MRPRGLPPTSLVLFSGLFLEAAALGLSSCNGSDRCEDCVTADASVSPDASPDAGSDAGGRADADTGVDTTSDANVGPDAHADGGWPDCDPAEPCCNADGTTCEHGCDLLGVVYPAGQCWPVCNPGGVCYTYDPSTRHVGGCSDGRLLFDAVSETCSCILEVGPGVEWCNGRDDDCDGETDEEMVCPCAEGEQRYEVCAGLGVVDLCEGVPAGSGAECCGPTLDVCFGICYRGQCNPYDIDEVDPDGDGFSAPQDCDDSNPDIYPGATELCNGLDDNCNFVVDEGC